MKIVIRKIGKKTLLEIKILNSINCKDTHQTFVSSESRKILEITKNISAD